MKLLLSLLLMLSLCGCQSKEDNSTFIYGDTTFNAENDEKDVNPHNGYSGWACIRYGVGETLFRYDENMQIQPWLASSYEFIDELTCKITLNDHITFSGGKKVTGKDVEKCLNHLIENHERAKNDLHIDTIESNNQDVIIHTSKPVPALINYLSDPYGCIINIDAGFEGGIVEGTGPYKAVKVVTDQGMTLKKNENYYNGTPKLDTIEVKTMSDGDTLTMALQNKELDAAYGLPYASLELFENDDYTISSTETSRVFFGAYNFNNDALKDQRVRRAINLSIDKKGFTEVLLKGNGYQASSQFPSSMLEIEDESYDLEKAKQLLREAGYKDTNDDGYVDKDGKNLTLRYLTYPSRQELPLLAESMQANLKNIGIELIINNTASHLDYIAREEFDIYASAFVAAPTGDYEYFFTTHCLDSSSKNRGHYHSDVLEKQAKDMSTTFNAEKRKEIAGNMTQTLLDDDAFFFASHLKMSIVMQKNVKGLKSHPCDYYEITVDLEK